MTDLHNTARALFQTAVDAANPAHALRPHLANLPEISGRYILISLGKAACAMMEEAIANLPKDASLKAIAVTNAENARDIKGCTVLPAGHPVPDEGGAAAGRAVIALLESTTPKDHVIALISGGGSALLPTPAKGITLADKAEVSRILLGAGVDIAQMNAVRQQLSILKGGGMARMATPAKLRAYILSDVIGDDLSAIASGPTVGPITTRAGAVAILRDHGIFDQMPAAVQKHLLIETPTLATPQAENTLIGSNRHSLNAVQKAAPNSVIVNDHLTGDVEAAANSILQAAQTRPESILVFGGETTVTLQGDGRGGRNQELALRVALLAQGLPDDWVFLSGGTDGRDGPTDAAGGIVDAGTIARIKDPLKLLTNNDSYTALKSAGDLLITGPTGTNVADIQIFLRGMLT